MHHISCDAGVLSFTAHNNFKQNGKKPGYFEVFSNLRYWCYPARLAIFALWAKFSHAAVDACLVLEGRDDDELPEVALGCCALSKIDLDGAPVGWGA